MSRNNRRSDRYSRHSPPDDNDQQTKATRSDLAESLANISAQLAELQHQGKSVLLRVKLRTHLLEVRHASSTETRTQERASSPPQDSDDAVSYTTESVSVSDISGRPPSPALSSASALPRRPAQLTEISPEILAQLLSLVTISNQGNRSSERHGDGGNYRDGVHEEQHGK